MSEENQEQLDKIYEPTNQEKFINACEENISSSTETTKIEEHNTLNDDIKSSILDKFVNFQGTEIRLKDLIQNHADFLNRLSTEHIDEIKNTEILTVSKIEEFDVFYFMKRGLILKQINTCPRLLLYHSGLHHKSLEHYSPDERNFIINNFRYEDNIWSELQEFKILIIADDVGSGKTTYLKHLAKEFKKKDNKYWISYIDARICSETFTRIVSIQDLSFNEIYDLLVEILKLNGIEAPIFKQLFKENKVILLWDHIDEKFQSILINFVYQIKEMTKIQQILTTRPRYSEIISQKFNRLAYKFFPYTYSESKNFEYALYRSLAAKIKRHFYEYTIRYDERTCKNIISVNRMLLVARSKMGYNTQNYSIVEKVVNEQIDKFGSTNLKGEMSLSQILQVHALKTTFPDDSINCLEIVKKFNEIQSKIRSIQGIYATNYEDNSIEFQSYVYSNYFITQFIFENVFIVNTVKIKKFEARQLIQMLGLIFTHSDYRPLYWLIQNVYYLYHENFIKFKDFQINIIRIIKRTKFLTKKSKTYQKLLKFGHDVDPAKTSYRYILLNDNDFWTDLNREIDSYYNPEEKTFDKTELKIKQQTKPKGTTNIRKFNQKHEISYQLNEFLEDLNDTF